MKQVLTIHINHCQYLPLPQVFNYHLNSNQWSIWYKFMSSLVFMMRPQGSNMIPPALEADALPTALKRCLTIYDEKKTIKLCFRLTV